MESPPLTACILMSLMLTADPPDPPLRIAAPQVVRPGDLVILSAVAEGGSDFRWLLVGAGKSFLPVDEGRRCVFASGQRGEYTFVLAAMTGAGVALAQHTVVVGGPDEPEPPDDKPEPTLPDGRYRLAAAARQWALATVALPPARRAESAQALAGSFESVAAAVAAGTLKGSAEVLAATTRSNRDALGADREAWSDWGLRLEQRLNTLHAGQALTPAAIATAWREVAVGLRSLGGGR